MIERNLGNAERIIRLNMVLGAGVYLSQQPAMNGIDWFVAICALMLALNGIFSRCYLWYVLDIDTSRGKNYRGDTKKDSGCSSVY